MSDVIGFKLPVYTLSGIPEGSTPAPAGVPGKTFVIGQVIAGIVIQTDAIININFDFSTADSSATLAIL